MRIPFLLSSSDRGFRLAELTHPSWHLTERGNEIVLARPTGGRVKYDNLSDPYSAGSWETDDIVSKGFLSEKSLVARLESTIALKDVHPGDYV